MLLGRLGGQVTTLQIDLSDSQSLDSVPKVDMVVCDPYPSADGSFESMFWSRARKILGQRSILITTLSPSHKPTDFSRPALRTLHDLGFTLLDLRADYGLYESFGFEFTEVERQMLAKYKLESTISHSKSLMAAEMTQRSYIEPIDFDPDASIRRLPRVIILRTKPTSIARWNWCA